MCGADVGHKRCYEHDDWYAARPALTVVLSGHVPCSSWVLHEMTGTLSLGALGRTILPVLLCHAGGEGSCVLVFVPSWFRSNLACMGDSLMNTVPVMSVDGLLFEGTVQCLP